MSVIDPGIRGFLPQGVSLDSLRLILHGHALAQRRLLCHELFS